MRLTKFFGTTLHYWLNLQQRYDLEVAKDDNLAVRIDREMRSYEEIQIYI